MSVSAITRLERGEAVKDDGVAAASLVAALSVPFEYLLGTAEHEDYQETPSWRAVKKIPGYVSDSIRERLTYFVDKYRELEEYAARSETPRCGISPDMLELRKQCAENTPVSPEYIECYANLLREHVRVSREQSFTCLESITEIMESFGIKVACWPLPPGVSGVSITYGDFDQNELPDGAVALVNRNHPTERRRFSLAHEWGHLVLPQAGSWQEDEAACNRFASALLMPSETLRSDVNRALGGPITHQSQAFGPDFLELKTKYGVSAAALLRRCCDTGLIQPPQLYSTIARLFGIRGWFREEPEPRWAGAEEPKGFETLLNMLDDEDRERGVDADWRSCIAFLDTA